MGEDVSLNHFLVPNFIPCLLHCRMAKIEFSLELLLPGVRTTVFPISLLAWHFIIDKMAIGLVWDLTSMSMMEKLLDAMKMMMITTTLCLYQVIGIRARATEVSLVMLGYIKL